MGMIVLESQLQIPVQPQRIVSRPRLLTPLEHQIVHHKLTLISAPAGYGKTTLLAEWARASSLPVAWLSLTGEEDGVELFMRYLLAAWEVVHPEIVETPLAILLGSQMPDIKAVLSAFSNAANEIPDHVGFVLDDYHLVEDTGIHEAVTFLLEHLPSKLHFILISRSDPPLPLARYRARGQLLELHAEDLRFSLEEASDFLNRSMSIDLSEEEIQRLQDQIEGWAAGLQLTALGLRHRSPTAPVAAMISGRQRFIADYLSQDVLDQLPVDVRSFLLRTSHLERLCASLCEAVTGTSGGQRMLEHLERQNLFVQPLDDERAWFRFHPLFADFLRSELDRRHADEVAGLHRRAAAWYATHNLPDQAFRHAVAGEDVDQVIEILDQYFNAKLMGGELKVVESWIDSLPATWSASYPGLDLMRAGLLAYTGALEACVRLIDDIEQRLLASESVDTHGQLAKVQAVRCFIACNQNDLARAETYADRALRDLPEKDVGFRPAVYGALGDSYRQNGRWEEAKVCYLSAADFTHSPPIRLLSAHIFGALADLELRRGRMQNAAGYWKKALAAIRERENWGRLPLPVIGWVYIRIGELLYEWNQLAEAWEHVSRGLEHAELGGDVRALIAGYLIAARLKLTEGEVETAAEYLERARPLVEQAQFPDWTSQYERFRLDLWLAQDNLRAAVSWSDEMLRSPAFEGRPESVVAQLAIARVLIVKGDAPSIAKAQALLERLLMMAEEEGQERVTIEALALEALADWQRGERAGALTSLEHALRLAEPEGYVRLFADLGLPLGRLLQEARSRKVIPDYVDRLLAAFGQEAGMPAAGPVLIEPLTEREMGVLHLLAAGLTNREIAERLVVSPETVKKHTANIYGKLAAGNRTQAVARARALNLLG